MSRDLSDARASKCGGAVDVQSSRTAMRIGEGLEEVVVVMLEVLVCICCVVSWVCGLICFWSCVCVKIVEILWI